MVTKIFLVDFENVHSDGVVGVDSLGENDEVVIFYSNNADSITFEMMHKLMFCKAKLSYYKVRRGGRNALDFQMSSYLGYLVKEHAGNKDVEFYLISRDAGFDFVVDFWESGNINVKPKIKRFFTIKAVFVKPKPRLLPKAASAPLVIDQTPEEQTAVETVIVAEEPAKVIELVEVDMIAEPPANPVAVAKKPVRRTTRGPAKKKTVVEVAAVEPVEPAEVPVEASPPAETADAAPFVMDFEVAAEVDRLLSASKSSHELYISMVKRFGQKRGVEIYRNTKSRFFVQKTG